MGTILQWVQSTNNLLPRLRSWVPCLGGTRPLTLLVEEDELYEKYWSIAQQASELLILQAPHPPIKLLHIACTLHFVWSLLLSQGRAPNLNQWELRCLCCLPIREEKRLQRPDLVPESQSTFDGPYLTCDAVIN